MQENENLSKEKGIVVKPAGATHRHELNLSERYPGSDDELRDIDQTLSIGRQMVLSEYFEELHKSLGAK